MDRTERQKLCIKRWLEAGGTASWLLPTGFGKTRTALTLSELLIKKNPNATILIVVPSEIIKNQWIEGLIKHKIFNNCKVQIVNTVVKGPWECDLLILDELHVYASSLFSQVFDVVDYSMILGLTGTIERLDGKEKLLMEKAPICDKVTVKEAVDNGWLSNFREYVVMLDVDLTEYNKLNQAFIGYFSQMGFDFDVSMKAATNSVFRNKLAKQLGIKPKDMAGIAYGWMKALKGRKAFVQSHPKKFEVAKKILNARQDKKCITFSSTIKDSESFGGKYVLHSKQSKKKNKEVLEAFNKESYGVLHTSRAAETGLDLQGINTEIILYNNSSKIRHQQVIGRAIRFEPGKTAEIFTLVIRGTQEWNWFQNSATGAYTVINESQLDKVLAGETIETRERENVEDKKFRF